MESADWVTGVLALAALGLGVLNSAIASRRHKASVKREKDRDAFERRTTSEAVEIERKLLEIEEDRHAHEQATRESEASEASQAEEESKIADLIVRFAYRDSARTWGRVIATNVGPADARTVELELWAERPGTSERVEVEPIRGEDYSTAPRLRPNESVHIGLAFSMGSPAPEDLRYQTYWVDDRSVDQSRIGRVPVH